MAKWWVGLCMAGGLLAQQPMFRTGTRLVQVDVSVHNEKGQTAKDLTKDDFTLFDKGKPQTIGTFTVTPSGKEPAPVKLPDGVVSNRVSSDGEMARSATIILFDRLNTTAANQAIARTKVLELLRSLSPDQKVGFYSLFDVVTPVQEFSEKAGPLIESAKALSGQGAPPADPAGKEVYAALEKALTPTQPLDQPRRVQITRGAFQEIARTVDGVPGRKTLLWLTSEVPLTYGGSSERSQDDEKEVRSYAQPLADANVAMFIVDPRGAGSSYTQNTTNTATVGGRGLGGGASSGGSGMNGVAGMRIISDVTGGKTFENVNNVADALRETIGMAEPCYTLGFYVDDKNLDGKPHDLKVVLSKKAEAGGMKPYFRQSYLADPDDSANTKPHIPLTALVGEKLDSAAIGLMAVSAPNPEKAGDSLVQIRVTGTDLHFEHRVDNWVAAFDLALELQTPDGKAAQSANLSREIALSQADLPKLAAGIIIDNHVPSPPAATHLKIVVQDKVSGASGSILIPVAPYPKKD